MTIPNVTETVNDGSLGTIASPPDQLPCVVMGVCGGSRLTNTLYAYGDLAQLRADLVSGPGLEASADLLAVAGQVYFMRLAASVAGAPGSVYRAGGGAPAVPAALLGYQPSTGSSSTSSVTHTGTGLATVTPSGTPTAPYAVRVAVVTAGAIGTATVQVSLDGGVSWSGIITSAASLVLAGTGLTLALAVTSGNFIAGDVYSFTAVPHAPVGTGTVAVSGTPIASGLLVVTIVATGSVGTATFSYSLDGGLTTTSGVIPTVASYTIPGTGLTLAFSGSFTAADAYRAAFAAGAPAGAGTVTVAGSPTDAFDVRVAIVADGTNLAAATGQFQYSLDGGSTWSPTLAIPTSGTYVLPNTGLTITFVDAQGTGTSYKAGPTAGAQGDVFAFGSTAPGYTASDLTAAITALLADSREWKAIHLTGIAATATAAATLAGVADSLMSSAFAQQRYGYLIMSAPDDTDADLATAFAAFSSVRVMVAAGFEALTSQLTGRVAKRPAGWPIAARRAIAPVHEDAARVQSGKLDHIAITQAAPAGLYRDERVTPALDALRFVTLRTWLGFPGVYATNGNLMAPPGSDFSLVQYREVMDVACRVVRDAGVLLVGIDVRLDEVTGYIDDRDAKAIEKRVTSKLRATLRQPKHVTDAWLVVKRNVDISSTKQLPLSVRVLPLGYVHFVSIDLGFVNPAIAS